MSLNLISVEEFCVIRNPEWCFAGENIVNNNFHSPKKVDVELDPGVSDKQRTCGKSGRVYQFVPFIEQDAGIISRLGRVDGTYASLEIVCHEQCVLARWQTN